MMASNSALIYGAESERIEAMVYADYYRAVQSDYVRALRDKGLSDAQIGTPPPEWRAYESGPRGRRVPP